MKRLIKQALRVAILVLSVLLLAAASAQATPPIKVSLVASKTSYGSGEPIKIAVSVFNDSGGDVITRLGFLTQQFHLKIIFTDPDGHLIRTRFLAGGPEPGPPFRYDAALVEIVPPRDPIAKLGDSTTVIDNALVYYDLPKFGPYTAEVLVALETFSQYDMDPITGDLFAYLTDRDQVFNPVASNKISFEILPPEPVGISAIQVQVNTLRVGGGVTPDTRRSTPEGVPVHLIRLSDISPDFQPIGFKTYPVIWANVDPTHSTITNSRGVAKFEGVSQDNYRVIAHEPGARRLYISSTIRANDSDWFTSLPIDVQLRFMVKANGRTVAARTTRLRGSDLLITEPEYVEWYSTEELYPFVFESVGDWGVTTSVSPPEGFVADNESLAAEVTNETEAVQFTITDVGSKWKETEVTYETRSSTKGKPKR
jgi:hypothetical protein